MKNVFVLFVAIAIILTMACGTQAATLVGHWLFDVDFNDAVGTNHGTAVGGATITAGAAKGAGALQLDGVNAYVDLTGVTLPNATQFSFAAWIYVESIPQNINDGFFSIFNDDGYETGDVHFGLGWDSAGIADAAGLGSLAFGENFAQYNTTDSVGSMGTWIHVAAARDQSAGTTTWWVNGVEVAGAMAGNTTSPVTIGPASIGAWDPVGAFGMSLGRFSDGRIDDLRVYDGVLTAAEVTALTAPNPSSLLLSPADMATGVSVDVSLAWDFANATAPTFDVYIGQDPNALSQVVSATSLTSLSLTLQPAAKYYWRVDLTDQAVTYTGETWEFTTAGLTANPVPAVGSVGLHPASVGLSWTGDSLAVTYDVYFGTSEAAVATANSASPEYQGSTTDLNITVASPDMTGAEGVTYYWRVDEVDASGIAVATGDVWNFTTGALLANWTLDEVSGTTAFDSVGNFDGTVAGTPGWGADGVFGRALEFDGTSTGIHVPHDLGAFSSFSLSLWLKSNEFGGLRTLLATDAWASDAVHINLNAQNVQFATFTQYPIMAGPLSVNRLYNLVLAFDGINNQIRCYVDGVEVSSEDFESLTPCHLNELNIGYWANDRYLNGIIDDVRIYSYALTGDDAVDLYSASPYAYNPTPADGATDIGIGTDLSWTAAADAINHTVSISTQIDDPNGLLVNPISQTISATNISLATLVGGVPQFETTYYWHVDEITDSNTISGNIWSFTTAPPGPYNPIPVNGAINIDPLVNVNLQWDTSVIDSAAVHYVYFGTDPVPTTLVATLDFETKVWNAGVLDYDKQYYWQIVNEDSSGTTYPGPVWSFQTIVPVCTAPPAGDLNGDCQVDIRDFAEIAATWLDCGLDPVEACWLQ